MFNGLPLNKYQATLFKRYGGVAAAVIASVIFLGNVVTAIVTDSISVRDESYVTKNGFPIFTSEKDYISLVKKYPRNPGVKLTIHRMGQGESYWQVAKRYGITIDTFIAANPHLTTLAPSAGTEVVVPARDGVLFAFDDVLDVLRMGGILDDSSGARGDYLPGVFSIFSTDDIRLVFFRNAAPVVVNDSLEKLYGYGKIFLSPVKGYYTSLFGDRVDPYYHDTAFHTGVDIHGRMNQPMHASQAGMVMFTGWRDGYGNTIIIQHDKGYSTLYAHLTDITVKTGQWVKKKEKIGTVGSTGRSTGPHVHFEIRRHDETINPLLYVW